MSKPLKIIFVSFIGDVKHTTKGFVKKDLEKVDSLNNIDGVTCLGVSLSDEIENDYFYSDNFFVKKIPKSKNYKFFGSWFNNIAKHKILSDFLSDQDFDVVLFRYDIATRGLLKLTKRFKNKIIFEHNSFEYDELVLGIKTRRALLKFSFKPGFFLYYIEGKFWPLFSENYLGKKIRSNALAGISVTNEITKYQSSLCKNYKNVTITNGIIYDNKLLHKPIKYDKSELKLFMLLGTGAPWHGVDRLMNGLALYKGNLKITIDIIGYYNEQDKKLLQNLKIDHLMSFINPLAGKNLDDKLNYYHMSIGTLAVHRKKLIEATPLKVRDSLMRGFPTIIGYSDTDLLIESDLDKYILKMPADDSSINFDKVENFANSILNDMYHCSKISELSKPKIDYNIKASQIVDFIKSSLISQ